VFWSWLLLEICEKMRKISPDFAYNSEIVKRNTIGVLER
jgi:hypothetical protein